MIRRNAKQAALIFACMAMFTSSAIARSLDEIKASSEIRMCIWADDMPGSKRMNKARPAGCRDDCTFEGWFYDWALAFAQTLAPEVEPKFYRLSSWSEQFFNAEGKVVQGADYTPALLASGTCDMYPTYLGKNAWRQRQIDIVTVLASPMLVMIHESHKDNIKTLADLAGKTTEAAEGGWYYTWLQQQNQTIFADNPVRFRTFEDDIKGAEAAIETGDIDFIMSEPFVAFWDVRYKFKHVLAAFAVGELGETGWGFRKQDKKLQTLVETWLDAQRADPHSDLSEVFKKYTGYSYPKFIELMTLIK